jgi:hypothetical protein
MMTHGSRKPLTHAAHAPRPVPSDSDVVVLALVTAQALEAQGEVAEAAQWLRRAADQARKDGHDPARAVAHALVVLANDSSPRVVSSYDVPPRRAHHPRCGAIFAPKRESVRTAIGHKTAAIHEHHGSDTRADGSCGLIFAERGEPVHVPTNWQAE